MGKLKGIINPMTKRLLVLIPSIVAMLTLAPFVAARFHTWSFSLTGEEHPDGLNPYNTLIMIDDERILEHLTDEEKGRIEKRMVRFRTLGCYPLTGAVESTATSLPEIIQEMLLTRTSERQGRVIDHDATGSMEEKKRQGYF